MSSDDAESNGDNPDSEEDESISLATFEGAKTDLSAADDEQEGEDTRENHE